MSHWAALNARGRHASRDADLLSGAVALICLGGLFARNAPLGLTLVLPLAVYVGFRLLGINAVVAVIPAVRDGSLARQSRLKTCQRVTDELRMHVGEADDLDIALRLRQILDSIDRILDVMREEGRGDESATLRHLVDTTAELLHAYLRLVRRDAVSLEIRADVLRNLETLESAFSERWNQLNREAIVSLGTLSAMIEISQLPGLPTSKDGDWRRHARVKTWPSVGLESGRRS